jgi:hypothetical protein
MNWMVYNVQSVNSLLEGGRGLRRIAVRQPRVSRKQAQQFLKSPGIFDKHLGVRLPPLVQQGYPDTQRSKYKRPHLPELHQYVSRHFHKTVL